MIDRRGFSLIELTVTLGVTSVIVGALGSVFVLSASALPGSRSALLADDRTRMAWSLSRLSDDISQAIGVQKATTQMLVLTLPDRTGDDVSETVTWAWGGTSGDSMTRKQNTDPAEIVLANVDALNMSYALESRTPLSSGPAGNGAEVLLASGGSTATTGTLTVASLTSIAQTVPLSFPSDAHRWVPTRIRIRGRKSSPNDGSTDVQLRSTVSGAVSIGTTVLFSTTVNESSLSSSGSWLEVAVTGVPLLSVNDARRISLMLAHRSGIESMRAFVESASQRAGTDFYTGSASLNNWIATADRSMVFELFGRVISEQPAASPSHQVVAVEVRISTLGGELRTSMPSPNRPAVIR
ncbi:MAG: PilW family protein [Phycisphaerales bacterium]|jgi:prepilin-type N-terminal cleavage/methylation domain-containing protein